MSEDTIDELMEATYRALCKQGYASLRMQDIADESSKSKAALHYHFDSKEELLRSFLEFLYDRMEQRLENEVASGREDPAATLLEVVEGKMKSSEESPETEFRTAMLELKAEAPYNETFREELIEFEELIVGEIRRLIEAGIDDGSVREDVSPEKTAQFIYTYVGGADVRQISTGRPTTCSRKQLRSFMDQQLFTDDVMGDSE